MKNSNLFVVGLITLSVSLSAMAVSNEVRQERALVSPDGISFFSKVSVTVTFDEVQKLTANEDGEISLKRQFQFVKGITNIRHAEMYFLNHDPQQGIGGFEDPELKFNPAILGRGFPMDKEKFSNVTMVTNKIESEDSEISRYQLAFNGLYEDDRSNDLVFLSGAIRYNPQKPDAINVSQLIPTQSQWSAGNLIFALVPSYKEALQEAYIFAEEELARRNPWGSTQFHREINMASSNANGFFCRTEWEGRMVCSFAVEVSSRVVQGDEPQGDWL